MHALVAGGADIIELGVPFSDPMADGPTIQRASERALLKHGMSLRRCWRCASSAPATMRRPVVLMGYANPIEAMGIERLRREAASRPASTACWWSTIRPRSARTSRRSSKAAASIRSSCWRRPRPTQRFARGRRDRQRLHLLRVAEGRHRRRTLDLDEVPRAFPPSAQTVGMPVGVGFGIRDGRARAHRRAWPTRW
jgi:tryptophan synthase alpha chain